MAKKTKPATRKTATAPAKNKAAGRSKAPVKPLTKKSLVAAVNVASQPATIQCTFTGGVGQITASLFRNGVLINMQSISNSGTINFSDVQGGDAISINGVCTGSANIDISASTTPSTPQQFTGIILAVFLIN